MPSATFNKLFKEFVANYKKKPTNIIWSTKQNDNILPLLEEILTITDCDDVVQDASIIDHLHPTVLLADDSHLLTCWKEFFKKYNSETALYSLTNVTEDILKNPDIKASDRYVADLEQSISLKRNAISVMQKTHEADFNRLTNQIEELKKQLKQIEAENKRLKDEIKNHQLFESLQPKVLAAQNQLREVTQLLGSLQKITAPKPISPSETTITVEPKKVTLDTPQLAENGPVISLVINQTTESSPEFTSVTPQPIAAIPKAPIKPPPVNKMSQNKDSFIASIQQRSQEMASARAAKNTEAQTPNAGEESTQKKNL